jgi:hypothetical protein
LGAGVFAGGAGEYRARDDQEAQRTHDWLGSSVKCWGESKMMTFGGRVEVRFMACAAPALLSSR